MFKFGYDCTSNLIYMKEAYDNLYHFYEGLEKEAEKQKSIAEHERTLRQYAQSEQLKEEKRKKRWRKLAISEGAIIIGTGVTLFFILK